MFFYQYRKSKFLAVRIFDLRHIQHSLHTEVSIFKKSGADITKHTTSLAFGSTKEKKLH